MADATAKCHKRLASTAQECAADATKPFQPEVANEAIDEGFKPLTQAEAKKVRELNPPLSLWFVLAGQAGIGILVALLHLPLCSSQIT